MSIRTSDIAVIGGGPAGMMAAIEAARHGASVAIIEYRDRLGGNFYKELRPLAVDNRDKMPDCDAKELTEMRNDLERYGVDVHTRATAWGVFGEDGASFRYDESSEDRSQAAPPFCIYLSGAEATMLKSRAIIVATGVYDRPLPFPGWTLPGIVSPGGAQLLLKNQGVLPGRRVLVAGTGPLLLAVAAALAESGAEVVALLEAAGMLDGWRTGPQALWGQGARIKEALGYLRKLRRHRVPLRFRTAIFEARGETSVEEVVFGRIDRDGQPMHQQEEIVAVDAVCLGYGFLPLTSLTMHLGCEHEFDPNLRAMVPIHDEAMATSVPNVFVAGDMTAAGGKALARIQGQIAGLAAAGRLGLAEEGRIARQRDEYIRAARKESRFGRALWQRHRMRPGLLELIDEDTTVCRCEAVQRRLIDQAIEEGYRDLNGVKRRTRAGMGPCQGRYCAAVLSELVAQRTGTSPIAHVSLTARPPILPIRAEEFVRKAVPGPVP